AQSLPASVATEIASPAPPPSRNGTSSHSRIHAHSASAGRAARFRPHRAAAFALVALAQAAAIIVVAVGLAWHNPSSRPKLQAPQTVQAHHPTPGQAPSAVKVASPVKVEADIEEGHVVVIRAEGAVPQVVDVTPEEKFYSVMIGKPVVHRVPLEDP